jgi:hypothetical protein
MTYRLDGHPLSQPMYDVLLHARRMGDWNGKVTDGRRSLAMQRARVAKHGLYNAKTNPHGAAAPSLRAPHINMGRANHAVDVTEAPQLVAALRKMGVKSAKQTVPTEDWHVQTGRSDLLQVARRIRKSRQENH